MLSDKPSADAPIFQQNLGSPLAQIDILLTEDGNCSTLKKKQLALLSMVEGEKSITNLKLSERLSSSSNPAAKLSDKHRSHERICENQDSTSLDCSNSLMQAIAEQQMASREQSHPLDQSSFNNDLAYPNPFPQAPPQVIANLMAQSGTTTREKHFNIFSNSFDDGTQQLDNLRPQRNCKSSTRKLSKTQNNNQTRHIATHESVQIAQQQVAIPLIQNSSPFNNFIKSKPSPQQQNQYQQALANQQIQRSALGNSFDLKGASSTGFIDLSNRSHLVQTSNSLATTPYQQIQGSTHQALGGSSSGNSSKPVTPHNPQQNYTYQSVILSAGSGNKGNSAMHLQQTPQSQANNMDPYTYFKWKQQKYKSSRTNNGGANIGPSTGIHASNGYGGTFLATGGGGPIIANQNFDSMQRQNSNSQMANPQQASAPYPQHRHQAKGKGNQTQKNRSNCSSGHGSNPNTSSTALTLKSLNEVSNPQYFISLRFQDRKVTDLNGLQLFKNLSELDISGNRLTAEIPELRQLQFLKKLNLSNNQIESLYPLTANLEILNLSYNQLKCIPPEVAEGLKNVTTLDLTSNGIETLDGIQHMKRLKRLIAKNNQIQDLSFLNQNEVLVEVDLENNPVDNHSQVFAMLKNKKDILVVNLKLSPVFLTISSYEQLFQEAQASMQGVADLTQCIDAVKGKLKHYASGCLYRSKRAYLKMRALQQQTKRSSSNFSNGSSSCGRVNNNTAGHNTGGRVAQGSNGNNAPFSPMLQTQQVHTPNAHQNVTQRLEDIEQLYDEILDEEEEHERKLLRIQKRKNRKLGLSNEPMNEDDSAGDDEDFEESMSMYEEDDFDIHQEMSFEEELEELQSYRNQNPTALKDAPQGNANFLNESTADFNKEIKQINQELREQFGNDLTDMSGQAIDGCNTQLMPEHLQSFQSTQSLLNKVNVESVANTQKKNPISFKLDLSKCTNQQSEDDEEDFTAAGGEELQDIEGGSLDIPGLQHVKVTDDSFRQFQKSMPHKSGKQSKEELKLGPSKQQLIAPIEVPKKKLGNNIIIPKLELSVLNQHQSIPIKSSQIVPGAQQAKNLSGVQSIRSNKQSQNRAIEGKPLKNIEGNTEELTSKVRPNQSLNLEEPPSIALQETCKNESCLKLREDTNQLLNMHKREKDLLLQENQSLHQILQEIKDVFKLSGKGDIFSLPKFFNELQSQWKQETAQQFAEIESLKTKCKELSNWRQDHEKRQLSQEKSTDLLIKCEEKERTINVLKDQINRLLLTQRYQTSTNHYSNALLPEGNFFTELEEIGGGGGSKRDLPQPFGDLKRNFSSKYQQTQPKVQCLLVNNPQFFYNSSSQQLLSTGRAYEADGGNSSITQEAEESQEQLRTSAIRMKLSMPSAGGAPITQSRKRLPSNNTTQDVKKVKRPQSVVTGMSQRRSSQGGYNNVLKIDPTKINARVVNRPNNFATNREDDASCGANEYCSNQDLIFPLDLSNQGGLDSKGMPLSQTMNKKVGQYLQRLKERNSSLQERLNGSFRDTSGGSHSAINALNSPKPQTNLGTGQMLNLNLVNFNPDNICSNPYILSPNTHKQTDSIQSYQQVPLQQFNTVSQAEGIGKGQQSKSVLGGQQISLGGVGPSALLKKVSSKDKEGGNQSRRQSQPNATPSQAISISHGLKPLSNQIQGLEKVEEFKQEEIQKQNQQTSQNVKQHSKTQRIHVNRVQYNQFVGNSSRAAPINYVSNGRIEADPSHGGGTTTKHSQVIVPPIPIGIALQGYQTNQTNTSSSQSSHINIAQLFSGRMQRADSYQDNLQQYSAGAIVQGAKKNGATKSSTGGNGGLQ